MIFFQDYKVLSIRVVNLNSQSKELVVKYENDVGRISKMTNNAIIQYNYWQEI